MAQNCSCCPLLKQLSGRHRSLLCASIRTFVYVSREPIIILLAHGQFIWISHVLSIIDEETNHLQNTIKTLDRVFFFPSGCRPSMQSLIFLHITGSDKLIQGPRSQTHLDHNIAYSCIYSRRGDISIESEIMSITYLRIFWDKVI